MKLETRLTLWYVGFFLILALAAVGLLFYAGVRETRSTVSAGLIARAEAAAKDLELEDGRLELDDDVPLIQNGVYLAVYSEDGALLLGALPPGFPADLALNPGEASDHQEGDQRYACFDLSASVEHGRLSVVIRAAASVTEAESGIMTLLRLARFILPALVLFASIGGFLIAKQSMRPVRKIAETARRIGESGDLSERIGLKPGRDDVHVLASSFDHMCDRLEEAFEKEKRFTSDASHELRTPTAVILAQCEYAAEHPGEAPAAIEVVSRQARKISLLTSQLLALSRADRGGAKLKTETLNLSELVEMVALEQAELAAEKGISVHTELIPNLLVRGDETMLMRLIINLVENAVRYGKPGGNVWMMLDAESGERILTVRDDGVGIAKADQKRIFERFYQADESRSGEGAGLGLAMAESIARAHGGRIYVESEIGAGSTFTVRLPGYSEKI